MTTHTMTLPALSPEGGFGRYLEEIKRFPMLSQEEEYDLAKRWADQGDIAAAHTLVTSHLKLVAKIAMGFRGYGLPLMEMISEGNIGLMQAVKKFDASRGFRLSTYAMWWIKAAIQEYILRSWSLVKIGTTAAQKKLFFNLRKLKNRLQHLDNKSLSPEDIDTIAHELDVPKQEVVDMNMRLTYQDDSLNRPYGNSEENDGIERIDMIADSAPSHELVLAESEDMRRKKRQLAQAITTLNPREQHILQERKLKESPATLEELAAHYGISRERVRQIEERAVEKLRAVMA